MEKARGANVNRPAGISLILLVIAAAVGLVFLRSGNDPGSLIRERMEAAVQWFQDGAEASGIGVGLEARKVDKHFTEAVEIAVPGWTGSRTGRRELLQLAASTFQALESVRFRQDFEIVELDAERGTAEGNLEITANLRASDGQTGRHEARLNVFFRIEDGDWKIDRVIPQ